MIFNLQFLTWLLSCGLHLVWRCNLIQYSIIQLQLLEVMKESERFVEQKIVVCTASRACARSCRRERRQMAHSEFQLNFGGNIFQVNEAIRIQFSIVLSSICWSIRIFEFNSVINESFHGSSSDAWSTSSTDERGVGLSSSVDNVVKIQISSFLQDHLCCRT